MSVARSVRAWVLWLFLLGLAFSITLSEASLALLVVLWLWALRDHPARAAQTWPLAGPVLAFCAATLLSALRSANPAGSFLDSKGLLHLLIVYVLVGLLADVEAADTFLIRLFALLTVHAGLSIVQVTVCPHDPWGIPLLARFFKRCDRAHGFFSIYMTLAGILTLVLLATLPRLARRAGDRGWWAWAPLAWAISGLGLLLTFTRGAWLGFLAGATSLALLVRRLRLPLLVGAIAGGLLLTVFLVVQSGILRARFQQLEDPTTLRARLEMWQSGFAIARDHPLTGVGPGQVKAVFPRYARPGAVKKSTGHVHNTPLQILAERGVLGLLAWLWIWVAFFLRAGRLLGAIGPAQRRERALVAGSLAAIVGFLVAGLFEFNFGDTEVVMVAYVVMALPFVVERAAEQGSDKDRVLAPGL